MARRRAAKKREIFPDPKFGDTVIAKFISCMMYEGKRSVSERIMYGALERIQSKGQGKGAVELFHEALDNVRPAVEVRSRRVGGATYPVPTEVRPERAQALAIRWLIWASRKRSENTMIDRLSGEIMDAVNSRGAAAKKREEMHKTAEANRAFAHYRW